MTDISTNECEYDMTQRLPKIIQHFQQQQTVGYDKNLRMWVRFACNAHEVIHPRVQQRFAAHQPNGADCQFLWKRPYIFRILLQIREGWLGHKRTKVRTTFTVQITVIAQMGSHVWDPRSTWVMKLKPYSKWTISQTAKHPKFIQIRIQYLFQMK